MTNLTDFIKMTIMSVLGILATFFKPLEEELLVLVLVFAMNFIFGLVADKVKHNVGFRFKKAFASFKEATTFFVLAVMIYTFGELKDWSVEAAVHAVGFLTYVLSWFYSVNILRNLKDIFRPKSVAWKVVDFLYYMVSIEFVEKIPYLNNYMNRAAADADE